MQGQSLEKGGNEMDELLKGAWDLHFHTAPDVNPRKYTNLELARDWIAAGMKGGVVKSHFADTTGRAAIVNELYPELSVFGGLALNRQAGGLNPDAVERMAQAGGKFLWFPTMDSSAYQRHHHGQDPSLSASGFLSVCGEDGTLLPEVYDILDIAAKFDLVVGTGHIGEKEGLPLVKEAFRRGVNRVVLTHAQNPKTAFSKEAQVECVKLGAVVEHSFFTVYYNRVSCESLIRQIRATGAEHCILVTDFGQVKSPGSSAGMRQYAECLMAGGITEQEIERMIKQNPAELVSK